MAENNKEQKNTKPSFKDELKKYVTFKTDNNKETNTITGFKENYDKDGWKDWKEEHEKSIILTKDGGVKIKDLKANAEYTFEQNNKNAEQIKNELVTLKNKNNVNDFSDTFDKLGKCAALRSINKLLGYIGKDPKAKDMLNTLQGVDFNDIYNIAFEKVKDIKKGDFDGMTPMQVMEVIARMSAANSLKENGKIDDTTYSELVKPAEEKVTERFSPDIATNGATRSKYESVYNKYNNSFTDGFEEYSTRIKEGKDLDKLVEPFTNKKMPPETKLQKGAEMAGKAVSAVGKEIGKILDITENSPDIYSKMIFALIGGGKKLWKNIKKQNALKRFQNYKNDTTSAFKKMIKTSMDKINKNKWISKSNEAK